MRSVYARHHTWKTPNIIIQWLLNLQDCLLSIAVSSADLYNVHWWNKSVHNFKIAVLLPQINIRLNRTAEQQCCGTQSYRDICSQSLLSSTADCCFLWFLDTELTVFFINLSNCMQFFAKIFLIVWPSKASSEKCEQEMSTHSEKCFPAQISMLSQQLQQLLICVCT